MGGWLSIAMAVTAAALTWAGEHRVIFWLAVVAGIADVWIFGVMHNYAYGPQARRKAQLIANLKAEGADPERLRDAEQLQVRIAPRDGECQGSCRMMCHAATSCGRDVAISSGLSVTAVMGAQFRVPPLQRSGWRARASA